MGSVWWSADWQVPGGPPYMLAPLFAAQAHFLVLPQGLFPKISLPPSLVPTGLVRPGRLTWGQHSPGDSLVKQQDLRQKSHFLCP